MTIAEKFVAIAEGEQKVFDAGKQAEYDAFWDMYQENGSRSDHLAAFAGVGWSNGNFKPKYDITPANAYMMFRNSLISGDLVEILSKSGITLDFSNTTDLRFAFMSSKITRLGVVDLSNATQLDSMFNGARLLRTVEKLILKSDGSQTFPSAFTNAIALEKIDISGVIGNNIDFSSCTKLSHDSLMSIIDHLYTFEEHSSNVLKFGATNIAKLTDTEKAYVTERGWTLA